MTPREQITARLREARDKSAMKLIDISAQSDISESTLLKWFNKGVMPGLDKVKPLCEVLGVRADWLVGLEDLEPKK